MQAIEIRPEVTMLSVLRHLNYKAWFAMAEFIDNALQSSLANIDALRGLHGKNYKLAVGIKIDLSGDGSITITDNAAGIAEADFPRAFRAAQAPSDRNGLSEFGMGMKSAACWFAEAWSVRTKAIGEPVERTIFFDINNIVENRIESLDTETRPMRPEAHYTVVSLRRLHHVPQGRTVGKIRDHLTSIYRVFIREGKLELSLNGVALSYQPPPILSAIPCLTPGVAQQDDVALLVRWSKEIDLDFGNGQRVHGFAALREVGSTTLAGFALFRRDRLIEGSYDESYRPQYIFKQTNSFRFQRLFGELHVEGFEVSHTKDGFRWEEFEDIFLEHLRDELERAPLDLLTQADNYRATPTKKTLSAQATAATEAVAEHVESIIAPLLVEAELRPAQPKSIPLSVEAIDPQASEREVCIHDGTHQWLITLRSSVDPATDEWITVAKSELVSESSEEVRHLTIDLALAHPFSAEFIGPSNENVELLMRMATAICIALVLAEDISGEPPQSFLHHFNYLLRGALTRFTPRD